MPDLVCAWEKLDTLVADYPAFAELIEQQWRELSHTPDRPPMPNWELGREWERAGIYKLWTARRDGELIGFIQWVLFTPLAFTRVRFAADQGWYFSPDERNAFMALTMWRGARDALRALGVEIMQAHDNDKRPLAGFFRRLGMAPVGTVYQEDIAQ